MMRSTILVGLFVLMMVFAFGCQEMAPTTASNEKQDAVGLDLQKKNIEVVTESSSGGTSFIAADNYIVEFSGRTEELKAEVNAQGGMVNNVFSQIGVASVSGISDQAAIKLSKKSFIKAVTRDRFVQWVDPEIKVFNLVNSESIGDDEGFWAYQWAPRAISAPQAWDYGARGTGVRVAVIDGGISSNHLDLDDNIDFAASKSFVDGFDFDEDAPGFRHATHVAGIIAAEDNARGTIGIAPEATIIALKALHDGSGSFYAVIAAIMYAADEAEADVINMSLGAFYPRNDKEAAQLNAAMGHAMNYAHQHGVTIIASAGNDGIDFDHAFMYVHMPSEAQHVICVSATGPVGFAFGETNFDHPASYTNYGQSLVDFAAPGGDDVLYPGADWYFDMVISPSYVAGANHYYSFADGTSMAAPHVAGVAALIIEANGGSMHPSQVRAQLQASADDLGKPGNDDFFGQGRVNAYRAVAE